MLNFDFLNYEAGDSIGYNLGLIGGVLMLLLFIYPIRKRFGEKYSHIIGNMNQWLFIHILFGISGPIFIFFHSKFVLKSMNSTVAFISMCLIFISGIVGRFFYRSVHKNLSVNIKELLDTQEKISQELQNDFLIKEIKETQNKLLHNAYLDNQKLIINQHIQKFNSHIQNKDFLKQLNIIEKKVNGFGKIEKLFSLWHLIHIPFLYLFLFSSIVHVIAVHMY